MSATTVESPKIAPYSNTPNILRFMRNQIFGSIPPVVSTSCIGDLPQRTVIITGSNRGLGLEAAKQLVELGVGRLILACRDVDAGHKASQAVLSTVATSDKAGSSKVQIDVWELDMASLASIEAFVAKVDKHLDRLDSIVLNAGLDLVDFRKSKEEDGAFEMTLMVNVVGTFVLARLMVDVLQRKAKEGVQTGAEGVPRISIVGSAVQFFAKYDPLLEASVSNEGILRYLSNETRWKDKIGEDRYYLSKGMVQMCTRQLAKEISAEAKTSKQPVVIVHAANPGWCRTELFRDAENFGSRTALKTIGWDGRVGARALVIGAIGQRGGLDSHGGYMSGGSVVQCCEWFETEQGEKIAEQLWREVVEVVKLR